MPRNLATDEDVRQLIRASGSIAGNYLEAQEGVSRKEFFYRIKVCRKEARESGLRLRLIDVAPSTEVTVERDRLCIEANELTRIFASIAGKDDTASVTRSH